MKRKMTSSIALALTVLLSVMTFVPTAQGQQRLKPVADTGVVPLGPNQILRLTVAAGDVNGDGIEVRFGKAAYMPLGCNNDGVCKHGLSSQSLSAPVMLNPGEAASIDITNSGPVRGMILSNNQNVRVNAMIVDMTTGKIIAVLIAG